MAAPWLTKWTLLCMALGPCVHNHVAFANPQPRSAGDPEPADLLADRGAPACIQLESCPPSGTGQAVDEAYISYAFEFWLYPPFAGNLSHPNTFSNNLLNNIGALQGTKPRVRVGGDSGDFSLYNHSITSSSVTKPVNTNYSLGVQQLSYYGDDFFESFQTFPDVKFIYQFNLAYIVANPAGPEAGLQSLHDTVPRICKALGPEGLLYWEYGNEPDLYDVYNGHNFLTDGNWTEADYVRAWKQGTAIIRERLQQTPECAGMASAANFKFVGPSLWVQAPNSTITLEGAWDGGLAQTGLVQEIAMHRYLAGSTGKFTYASTLLNHTHSVTSLQTVLTAYDSIADHAPQLVVDETSSLVPIGVRNFTDTFADALWNLDWALHLAANSVSRVHFQQGIGFYYNSWEVTKTLTVVPGTKAPYYGNLAAAYAIGDGGRAEVRVYEHDLNNSPVDVAYSVFVNGELQRVAVLNLRAYFNGTRGAQTYTFSVPQGYRTGTIKRLVGPSSDNQGGVQWDGNMYGMTPNNGLASSPGNVTTGETFAVRDGEVSITLEDSSAAVLQFS